MNPKLDAARRALTYVQSGMILGLGSGTTAAYFVDLLGEELRAGRLRGVVGVPTSQETAARARTAGIPLASIDDHPHLDLAVDGADEIDPELNLIKGLGKALLREKIVESHARRFLVIASDDKLVARLGRGPLPLEVVPFGAPSQVRWLQGLCQRAELWRDEAGAPYVTDNGNHLIRCWFAAGIDDLRALARALADRPGIVEHGLFLDMATEAIVAGAQGLRVLAPATAPAGESP
ncbi:MAG: ribose 5-phosphate isomerase A [Anaerolineae bacterium]|jgi:ribose 5-phosphate isomerase A|nr:ribose 5-phosphate isomerase A [Anaerolineae bacterium]MDX9831187.1 ribose 5-phosphate isomerase A [Anaerolineae bacterium]